MTDDQSDIEEFTGPKEKLELEFDRLDSNGNGFLDVSEIRMLIENLLDDLKLDKEKLDSNELVQTCIELLDENRDGKIDKELFVKVCSKNSVIRYHVHLIYFLNFLYSF